MFTWQQVAKHNTAESAWVYVDDTVYDVTSFIDRHPGGRDMILLMAGRDITDLFRTYHPFTDSPMKVIQQFKIGKLKGRSELPIFQPDSGFYKECRLQIGRYFKDNNLDYKIQFEVSSSQTLRTEHALHSTLTLRTVGLLNGTVSTVLAPRHFHHSGRSL